MDQEDSASGWCNDDLSSVRVNSSYPTEYDTVPSASPTTPPSPPPKGRKAGTEMLAGTLLKFFIFYFINPRLTLQFHGSKPEP